MDWAFIFFAGLGVIGAVISVICIYCAGHAAGVGEGFERGVSRGHEFAIEAVGARQDP